MRKFTATILAILYLGTSTGATIHMHYCMGKLISSGLWHSKTNHKACSFCGMTKKKSCCEDKHKVVNIDKQYDAKVPAAISNYTVAIPRSYATGYYLTFRLSLKTHFPQKNSPPGSTKIPLHITYCVYRI